MNFKISWTQTTSVTSYIELKDIVISQYSTHISEIPTNIQHIDPFLYDLNHAIQMIEDYGETTKALVSLVPGTTDELVRIDTCSCAQLLKCPNGTTSTVGSDDIYDCVKTSSEVLQRVAPIPLSHSRLLNGTGFSYLSGSEQGIGSIILEPLEVATLTINTTLISRNMTYKDHYQISIYTDCKPCPPRYNCNLKSAHQVSERRTDSNGSEIGYRPK